MPGTKKTALITGASMGIGLELARLYAQDKYNLVLVARTAEKLLAIKNELEDKYFIYVKCIVSDLTLNGTPLDIFDDVKREGLKISVLINNAGFIENGNLLESDMQDEMALIQVNITALTHLTKLFSTEMALNGGGKILNIASTPVNQPAELLPVYNATKAYVVGFSEALHKKLKDKKVTVTALCPEQGTKIQTGGSFILQNDNHIKKSGILTPEEVALEGYKALKENKPVAIAGKQNGFFSKIAKLLSKKSVIDS